MGPFLAPYVNGPPAGGARRGAIQTDVDLFPLPLGEGQGEGGCLTFSVCQTEADVTVADETVGRCALLRVPRPLRGLRLDLRKAHHPTVLMRLSICLRGRFEAMARSLSQGSAETLSFWDCTSV